MNELVNEWMNGMNEWMDDITYILSVKLEVS